MWRDVTCLTKNRCFVPAPPEKCDMEHHAISWLHSGKRQHLRNSVNGVQKQSLKDFQGTLLDLYMFKTCIFHAFQGANINCHQWCHSQWLQWTQVVPCIFESHLFGMQFLRTRFYRWLDINSLFIIEFNQVVAQFVDAVHQFAFFLEVNPPFLRWSQHQCLEMQLLRRDDVDSRRDVVASCKATSVELVVVNRSQIPCYNVL